MSPSHRVSSLTLDLQHAVRPRCRAMPPSKKRPGPKPVPCPRCSKIVCQHCACMFCAENKNPCEAILPIGSRESRRLCKNCREVCMKVMCWGPHAFRGTR